MRLSRLSGAVAICCIALGLRGPTATCHNVVEKGMPSGEEGYVPTVYRKEDELVEAFESVKQNYFTEPPIATEDKDQRSSIRRSWESFIDYLSDELSRSKGTRTFTHFYLPAMLISVLGYFVLIILVSLVFKCEKCKGCNDHSGCTDNGHCCCICTSVPPKKLCDTCQKCENCARRNQWYKNCCILVCFTWMYWYAASPLVALPVALIVTEAFYSVPHHHEHNGHEQRQK